MWQTSSWSMVTHMEMLRTQYLVFPNEPKGSCFITAILLTACQRPLLLHPGLYFRHTQKALQRKMLTRLGDLSWDPPSPVPGGQQLTERLWDPHWNQLILSTALSSLGEEKVPQLPSPTADPASPALQTSPSVSYLLDGDGLLQATGTCLTCLLQLCPVAF